MHAGRRDLFHNSIFLPFEHVVFVSSYLFNTYDICQWRIYRVSEWEIEIERVRGGGAGGGGHESYISPD